MRIPRLVFAALFLVAGASAQEAKPAPPSVRGMTISCPGSGRIWGTDAMVSTMAELAGMGVNWVTIHPYAGISNEGRVRARWSSPGERAPEWLSRPIREAHRLGLKIMIKPHIAYWGSKFSWRGAIEFTDPEERARFFRDYEAWIEAVAAMSRDADAFVVGTELDRLVGHEKEWRRIIAKVRKRYRGPITYAANWSDYEKVGFWDALDVVGIQGYFPVIENRSDEKAVIDEATLRAGWKRIATRLRAFGKKTNRKICLTELGYNRSADAPYTPWEYRTGGNDAERLQTLCTKVALEAIEAEPAIVGSFLWKWFPGRRRPRNFNMHDAAVRRVIEDCWKKQATAAGKK